MTHGPSNELVEDFESHLLSFEHQAWQLGMKILLLCRTNWVLNGNSFTKAHQRDSQNYLSTLRMLHYLPMKRSSSNWHILASRCPYTDFDCLTMVFQQETKVDCKQLQVKTRKTIWCGVLLNLKGSDYATLRHVDALE